MPENYYKEALKLGQKEKRHLVSQGRYPYLTVLEDMMSKERINTGVRLGLMNIPTEFIVGTKTEGRTNAFAANFMPLLDERTEFCAKWQSLCKAHMEEGIREPIKAYEYMNRYYVEEGNKRVSVLKFFGAVSIPAQVIRILPPKIDAPEIRLYYEFLDFYKCTKINYIEFSREGSYQKLQKLLGKKDDENWTEEECSIFRANYYYFAQLFDSMGGKNLKCTSADAFLSYINIYGYENFKEKGGAQIKEELQKIWQEFELLQEEETIDIKLVPEEGRKKSIFDLVFGEERSTAKVAFIYDKTPATSGWIYGHELGRLYLEKQYGSRIQTTAYENAMLSDPKQVIEQAIADGNDVIFTTSPKLLNASLTAAVAHQDKMILNCSLNKSHRYIRTYYARMYEVKFLIGVIAGIMAGDNDVGFICDYPIVGQIAGINAFAQGVKMVNPRAKVYLEWSSQQGIYVAVARLRKRAISIISAKDLGTPDSLEGNAFGLFCLDRKGHTNLAMPLWHWGVYYEKLMQSILNRSFKQQYETSNKALNYYWGMSAGVIELICSKNVPQSVQKLTNLLTESICSGLFSPFSGPMCTQAGKVIDPEGEGLSLEEIINMDWLLDNVVGYIPKPEQLSEEGKATVESAGAPAGR